MCPLCRISVSYHFFAVEVCLLLLLKRTPPRQVPVDWFQRLQHPDTLHTRNEPDRAVVPQLARAALHLQNMSEFLFLMSNPLDCISLSDADAAALLAAAALGLFPRQTYRSALGELCASRLGKDATRELLKNRVPLYTDLCRSDARRRVKAGNDDIVFKVHHKDAVQALEKLGGSRRPKHSFWGPWLACLLCAQLCCARLCSGAHLNHSLNAQLPWVAVYIPLIAGKDADTSDHVHFLALMLSQELSQQKDAEALEGHHRALQELAVSKPHESPGADWLMVMCSSHNNVLFCALLCFSYPCLACSRVSLSTARSSYQGSVQRRSDDSWQLT